jgi:hypothetical protein
VSSTNYAVFRNHSAAATASLLAALPPSILSIAATNTAEGGSIILSEILLAPTQPAWFLSLPPAVQTYFVTSFYGALTETTVGSTIYASFATVTPSVQISIIGTSTLAPISPTSQILSMPPPRLPKSKWLTDWKPLQALQGRICLQPRCLLPLHLQAASTKSHDLCPQRRRLLSPLELL